MKILFKILLSALSLAGLAFSFYLFSLFFPLPAVVEWTDRMQQQYGGLDHFLAGFAGLLCIGFLTALVCSLFFRGFSPVLTFRKPNGTLVVSKQAVQAAVRHSFAHLADIRYADVKIKLCSKPEKTKIRIKLAAANPEGLSGLSEVVRAGVENILANSLGFKPKSIHIQLLGVAEDAPKPTGRVV